MKPLTIAIRTTVVFTVLTGLIYPGLVTVLAKTLFPSAAAGSLVMAGGRAVGSDLIGQRFTRPEYFHGRPSAAGNDGYDAAASSGSNLGPTSQKLVDRVKDDLKKFHAENPAYSGPIPADLLTASASGLDPHLSPASAEAQTLRVAAARGVAPEQVRRLIAENTEGRQWGFLGDPRVSVLRVNLALDRAFSLKR
jgi:potassium-transporting ATPase KdpC subunit